jgi:hypothetical protein
MVANSMETGGDSIAPVIDWPRLLRVDGAMRWSIAANHREKPARND